MIFNGHTPQDISTIDQATMNEIIVMYADGVIGNNGMIRTLGNLTAGVFNYMRSKNAPAYSLKSIIDTIYPYIYREPEADPSDSLLLFMSQSPNFSIDKFKR